MIMAKIETARAVTEVDEIMKVADAVMVARGDLGVRLPLEDVPHGSRQRRVRRHQRRDALGGDSDRRPNSM